MCQMTSNSKKTETLYVRGIDSTNVKFLTKITKEKGYRYIKQYLNDLLTRQRLNHENKSKQLKQKKTYRRKSV